MIDEYNLDRREILEQKIRNLISVIRKEKKAVSFRKNFLTFDEAQKLCEGYESEKIFNKVKKAALMVKSGEACYERDGCLFYHNDFYLQLIAILYNIYLKEGVLNIVDFGGSLGSMYYQNRNMILPYLGKVSWNIIEQKHFVDWGKKNLEDEVLKFYYSLDEVKGFSCVLFGGSLQYLRDYKHYLNKICEKKCKYVILDRTAVCDETWISIEQVHEPIYEATYPVIVFNEYELIKMLENMGYILQLEWVKDVSEVLVVGNKLVRQKSYFFCLRE